MLQIIDGFTGQGASEELASAELEFS
jgi:hypothetical protein